MYFVYSLISVISVLLLLIPGFILRRMKILSATAAKDMSAVLLYVSVPALTFHCMMGVDIYSISPVLIILSVIAALITHGISYLAAKLIFLKDSNKAASAAASFASTFSNCGFLGIPLTEMAIKNCSQLSAVLTETVSEALFYVTIYNIAFNILSWTVGLGIYSRNEKKSVVIKKALLSPVMISTFVCIPFMLTGFSLFDPVNICGIEITQIGSVIEYLYGFCVPLSMTILGTRLADVSRTQLFASRHSYMASAVKLVLTPLAVILLMFITKLFTELSPAFIIAFTVMAGAPAATNCLAFAECYDGDKYTASSAVLLSTLLSALTLPLMLTLAVTLS